MTARSAALGPHTSLAIRLHCAIATLDRFPLSVLQLMFRIAIAAVFWSSGLTKIASWDTTIALFRDEYMVPLLPPELAAVMSATFELSCSALIVVGLATRLATLFPSSAYGKRMAEAFAAAARSDGVELVASVSFEEKATTFIAQAKQLWAIRRGAK